MTVWEDDLINEGDPRRDLIAVMERLYYSEINCSASSFWDGGWTIRIGDEMNGYRAELVIAGDEMNWHGIAADWLHEQAAEHWPSSDYARSGGNPRSVRR